MSLQIEHSEVAPGVILIKLAGRIMLGTESQRIETLMAELIAQGHRNFVVDLSEVSHIDSTGIGRFISSFNQVRQVAGVLRMAGATGQVRSSFRVTRLDSVFPFYDDVETACADL